MSRQVPLVRCIVERSEYLSTSSNPRRPCLYFFCRFRIWQRSDTSTHRSRSHCFARYLTWAFIRYHEHPLGYFSSRHQAIRTPRTLLIDWKASVAVIRPAPGSVEDQIEDIKSYVGTKQIPASKTEISTESQLSAKIRQTAVRVGSARPLAQRDTSNAHIRLHDAHSLMSS